MTTCHQVRQKYPATNAGKAANGSMNFVTKIIKATFKSNSDIAALPPIATPIGFFGMSALSQKRTRAVQKGMSALLLKADMRGATKDVRQANNGLMRRYFDLLFLLVGCIDLRFILVGRG